MQSLRTPVVSPPQKRRVRHVGSHKHAQIGRERVCSRTRKRHLTLHCAFCFLCSQNAEPPHSCGFPPAKAPREARRGPARGATNTHRLGVQGAQFREQGLRTGAKGFVHGRENGTSPYSDPIACCARICAQALLPSCEFPVRWLEPHHGLHPGDCVCLRRPRASREHPRRRQSRQSWEKLRRLLILHVALARARSQSNTDGRPSVAPAGRGQQRGWET